MSIKPFRFKKFTLSHTYGFKVTTEACIFGAYIAKNIRNVSNALEIGTGTGLLSLMYAQNNTVPIAAIEIDALAAKEAKMNFDNSGFAQLSVYEDDINTWAKSCTEKFDFIFSNPPFFKQHLTGHDAYQNSAKHQTSLNLDSLAALCTQLLNPHGQVAVLLPVYEQKIFGEKIAQFGFFPYKVLNVYNRPDTNQFRKIVVYAMGKESQEDKLVIYNNYNTYTIEFKELMHDYYIIF